jgi:hypothetical protein
MKINVVMAKKRPFYFVRSKSAINGIELASDILLCLHQKIIGVNNTFLRFEKLAALEPQNATIYKACFDASLFCKNSELRRVLQVTPVEGIWT